MINESSISLEGPPQETLQELVRGSAALTGTSGSCEHGVCGACTVLLDGRPVRSCLTLSSATMGRTVVTIEGLEALDQRVTSLLREEFVERNAFQCGYCTSGMLVLSLWWLTTPPEEREACRDVSDLLEGNLCRCTGYQALSEAITSLQVKLEEAIVD